MTTRENFKDAAGEGRVDLKVAWYGEQIGTLHYNNGEMTWSREDTQAALLFRFPDEDDMPAFLKNLQPEGWLRGALGSPSQISYLRSGIRYLSNITIAEDESFSKNRDPDQLTSRLKDHTDGGVWFSGSYLGPRADSINNDIEKEVAERAKFHGTPRMSGMQMKMPVALDSEGQIHHAMGGSFTHILKFGGTEEWRASELLEWMGLQLAGEAGLDVPAHALVNVGESAPPALLVERFDVPQSADDQQRYLIQDMCTAARIKQEKSDINGLYKFSLSMEKVAKLFKEKVHDDNDPDALQKDLENLYRKAVSSWAIRDGDMHLKNISFLKVQNPGEDDFTSTRLSPTYDTLNTSIFHEFGDDEAHHGALTINGKKNKLKVSDFVKFGTESCGLSKDRSLDIFQDIIEKTANRAVEIGANIPNSSAEGCPKCDYMVCRAVTDIVDRAKECTGEMARKYEREMTFSADVSEWDNVYPEKKDKNHRRYRKIGQDPLVSKF